MSDSESCGDAVGEIPSTDKQMIFANLLREHSILLSKSQVPSVKEKKAKEMPTFVEEYAKATGVLLLEKQAWKKINNMKNDVKGKSDARRTGNKPIILKDYEKAFLDVLQVETNPTFSCVKGAMSVGIHGKPPQPSSSTASSSSPKNVFGPSKIPPRPAKKLKVNSVSSVETQETGDLSTPELQRLVLLEQLKLIRMQQQEIQQQPAKSQDTSN
ncbi:uncharacterized protein LOC135492974 [Lineus longissimus]|uniref:uncharacterized protein LOC135492974 n=1 Tax=Lineus longissimus TaxID=88925 RepID=UPI00315CF776